jgi:lipopolysaccharide export system protein LptA
MKRRVKLAFTLTALGSAALLYGKTAEPIIYQGASEQAAIEKVTGIDQTRVEKNGRFLLTAKPGERLHWVSSAKHMDIECKRIEGKAVKAASGITLDNAVLTGGVTAVITRSSAAGSTQTTVTGDSAEFKGDTNHIHVLGGVHVNSIGPGSDRSTVLTGSTADLTLSKTGSSDDPLQLAVVEGPVNFEMHGMRTNSDEGQAPTRVPFTVKGTSDHMVYSALAHTITFTGDVHIKGDDPSFIGDQRVAKEVINLAKDNSIESVDSEGGPGETIINVIDIPKGVKKPAKGGGGKH